MSPKIPQKVKKNFRLRSKEFNPDRKFQSRLEIFNLNREFQSTIDRSKFSIPKAAIEFVTTDIGGSSDSGPKRVAFGRLTRASDIPAHSPASIGQHKKRAKGSLFSAIHLWGPSGRGHRRKISTNFRELSATTPSLTTP